MLVPPQFRVPPREWKPTPDARKMGYAGISFDAQFRKVNG
jgi:hypothetical protein